MKIEMHTDWKELIGEELSKEYFLQIKSFLESEKDKIIFPPPKDIFNAFIIPPSNIKVIILGQDPYHGPNQAHGFSFSVQDGINPPPSLKNIFKEIQNEFGCEMNFQKGNLDYLVKQGVLLLNTILTVEKGKPKSHSKIGWEIFTDEVIKKISAIPTFKVFLLWGDEAKKKQSLIKGENNLVLMSRHPSPYQANNGFFGNNHFLEANKFLKKNNITPINWCNM